MTCLKPVRVRCSTKEKKKKEENGGNISKTARKCFYFHEVNVCMLNGNKAAISAAVVRKKQFRKPAVLD